MIHFIFPDLLEVQLTKSMGMLGLDVDVRGACEYLRERANTPAQRKMVLKRYGDIIPDGTAVYISKKKDGNEVCRLFGIPNNEDNMAAGIIFNSDSRHRFVLVLVEEYLYFDPHVVDHEVVHLQQCLDGRLVYTKDDIVRWTVPGQECDIEIKKDLLEKQKAIKKRGDHFLWYELQKPWELEAYATTTPLSVMKTLSPRCQQVLENYLDTH